jgi:hypothetical protein
MRLFELSGSRFQDDFINVLKVMQGRADSKNTQSIVTWPALTHMMIPLGYGEINQQIIDKIRDRIDPNNELIHDINDNGIVLKTAEMPPENTDSMDIPTSAKTVDQMAHNVVSDEF